MSIRRLEENIIKLLLVFMVILIIITITKLFISPIYEKVHYTKLTGIEVSYFDALFITLDPSKHTIQIDKEK